MATFNLKKSIRHLNGKRYSTAKALREDLHEVRIKYLSDLPPDYGTQDMMETMRAMRWLREDPGGVLFIQFDDKPPATTTRSISGQRVSVPQSFGPYWEQDPSLLALKRIARAIGLAASSSAEDIAVEVERVMAKRR